MDGGAWSLCWGGQTLLRHTADRPFATAIRREKTYAANRGTVKVTEEEKERVALYAAEDLGEGRVRLFGGGRELTVAFEACEGGAELTFTGEPGWAYRLSLPALAGEAVFGGGEQYRQVDLRGQRVVNFVSEHIKASTIVEKALLPRKLYREKDHAAIGSYAPMPVFVTDKGRVFLFDTPADGVSEFGEASYDFTFDACPRRLALLAGLSYRQAAEALARRIPNRQYIPAWCHEGMILGAQGGTAAVLEKVEKLLSAGAKVCGVWCQDWSGENRTVMGKQVWWNWEADALLYPGLKEAIARLRQKGVRFLAYINPYLVKGGRLYELCAGKGYLITRPDGSIYHIKSTTFDAGMLDLTNPEAVRFIQEELIWHNMLELGISGWMADFGEYLPVDCVLHSGDPAQLHNQWPVLWAKINREAIEKYGSGDEMFFTRSGYLGIQTYAPILWNGDQHTDFTRDYGLPCVMPASFSLGFSGVTMVHCDVGGFFSFGKLKRDDELFIRWMEMGAFSLLMRSHESIRPWANSQPYDESVLPHTAALTSVHASLAPYIAHCAAQAGQGVPALRPDFWEEDSRAAGRDEYAYYLGDDLFVCPVVRRGERSRMVHLPAGEWVHLWSGVAYHGGSSHVIPAPLGKIPVFYRAGSPFAETFRAAAESCQKQRKVK